MTTMRPVEQERLRALDLGHGVIAEPDDEVPGDDLGEVWAATFGQGDRIIITRYRTGPEDMRWQIMPWLCWEDGGTPGASTFVASRDRAYQVARESVATMIAWRS